MSTINGIPYSSPRNLNIQGLSSIKGSTLRFARTSSSNPLDSTSNGLYIDASNNLIYSSQGAITPIGAQGSGGAQTWATLFNANNTFTLTGTTWTIDNNTGNNDVLTLTNSGAGSGDCLQITNAGTGKDINGTSGTWSVSKAGAAVLLSVDSATFQCTSGNVILKATGAGVVTIGANTNTITIAKATTFSSTITVTDGLTDLISTSNSAAALRITNNTVTTLGAGVSDLGVAVIRSTSLTTGNALLIQAAEGTLSTGYYINCWDSVGVASVFKVGAKGATTIVGAGGSTVFSITGGDAVMSDGSVAITDADNAATFSVTNNTATSASVFVFAGSGVFTGTTTTSFMTLTPSGLTTGTALYIVANAATTSVGVVDIISTSLTTGSLLRLTSSTANFTTGAKMLEITLVAATAGNGVSVVTTGAYTGTGLIIASAGAMTSGVMLSLTSTTGLTTGSLIRATSSTASAIATNGAISLVATGAFTTTASTLGFVHVAGASTVSGTIMSILGGAQTTGIALNITDPSVGMTSGSLLRVITATTGAVATNGIVSIQASGAYTSTSNAGLLNVSASATTAGTIVNVVGNALTTGVALKISGTGVYTGTGFVTLTQSGLTTGVGVLATLAGLTTGSVFTATAAIATMTTGRYYSANDGATEVFGIGLNGHIISTVSASVPTIAVTTQNGITAAAITAGGSDTCGVITTTGTSTAATVLDVTFGKTYTTAPKFVILGAANAAAAMPNTGYYVSAISATGFTITVAAGGTYTATPSWRYLVIA